MQRDNPQLGEYYVFNKVVVKSASGKTVTCSDDNKYDMETGERKTHKDAAYGSSWYSITNIEDGEKEYKRLKDSGARVSGLNI